MKIIITGIEINKVLEIAKNLININDDLSIASSFTSDELYKDKTSENYIEFLDANTINLSYKNNAFLYVHTENYISTGITLDEFYNNDIICLTNKNFNKIINSVFNNNECLIVWIDTKNHNNINISEEIREINYLEKTLSNLNYLYFLDEDIDTVINIINRYIKSSEECRKELLEEYC
jgi:hypothetical protein